MGRSKDGKDKKQTNIVDIFKNMEANKAKQESCEENMDEDEGQPRKRPCNATTLTSTNGKPNKVRRSPAVSSARCYVCHQLLSDPDLRHFEGHPEGAVEEDIALTDQRLCLFTGDEDSINEMDERPQQKITGFSVYDREGHLCPFDTGLVEKNVLLYFSGYMKAIIDENPHIEGGIPVKKLGPINEWWVAGFDGGEHALLGFSTAYAEYFLMEPSESYAPYVAELMEKIHMSKAVIEFLCDTDSPTYEDLLNRLQTIVPINGMAAFTEDMLLKHAQFICDQVQNFDKAGEEYILITTPCMRSLVHLSGITLGKRRAMRRAAQRDTPVMKKTAFSKATTTPLVRSVFESFFKDQIDESDKENKQGPRRTRCGVCESCQLPDCGQCPACKNMSKYGGTGTAKQCCVMRRCPNMAVQLADDNEEVVDDTELENARPAGPPEIHFKQLKTKQSWIGEMIKVERNKSYYSAVNIDGETYKIGDYVLLSADVECIGKIVYFYESSSGAKLFHGLWFSHAKDTVLGEIADAHELMFTDICEDIPVSSVRRKVIAVQRLYPGNWREMGGIEEAPSSLPADNYWFRLSYDNVIGEFKDLPAYLNEKCDNPELAHKFCGRCIHYRAVDKKESTSLRHQLEKRETGEIVYAEAFWNGNTIHVGDCVMLDPSAYSFKIKPQLQARNEKKKEHVDEDLYPEYFRKALEQKVRSNDGTLEPFRVALVEEIYTRNDGPLIEVSDIMLRVRKFYRPENTHLGSSSCYRTDWNLLYWCSESYTVNMKFVVGMCCVFYRENIKQSLDEWFLEGPHRFYFSQMYIVEKKCFEEPPAKAQNMGAIGRGKGKGKGKGKSSVKSEEVLNFEVNQPKFYPKVTEKLKTLDVFSGCGGLSNGLKQSGIAESAWAIEFVEPAAQSFRLNEPQCIVFNDDCNALLRLVMDGHETNDKGQLLPQKGQVDLLCGGPPCQGFSGMNRFNQREYSLFKNSLIASYLSYCDYYRPRHFILENVRNFIAFKNSMVLKLTMRCLVAIGYQCKFGVVQAGGFGVPQTRRRAIILAAAPGEKLPDYPQATHCFSQKAGTTAVVVGSNKFDVSCKWSAAAYRNVTVRDSLGDLPPIPCGFKKDTISYNGDPVSHFQRLIRGSEEQQILRDHICKEMSALVEARIAHIPTAPGSDWRDLPNIEVRLNDGTYTKKLVYTHHNKVRGVSSTGALRGVCACASTGKKSCDPMDRQFNTLIPWCLPHTGDRHNHWSSLYGRLDWDGYFSTTVTNPEPMGKQGLVLHPEQNRLVSVRECARSQGFPDTFRFYGNILDKHRQIGNAVPPPLGLALGLEIRKCLAKEEC